MDTPGLLSITTENHNMTHQYIAQADFVLWAISSRDLGSAAVNEYIRKIQASGKPLIGIVTKVDTPEIRQEIIGYVEKQFGTVFEEIFYVSAAEACTLQAQGASDWACRTGFDEVLECIADLSGDKEHSTLKTLYYQFQRERELHQKIREIIRERKQNYSQELKIYEELNCELKDVVSEALQRWLDYDFYREEKNQLLNAEPSEWDNLFQQFTDNAYYTRQIQQKYDEIANKLLQSWDDIAKNQSADPFRVSIDLTYHRTVPGQTEDETAPSMGTHLVTGLKQGAMAGILFAGYSAWLGPVASYVTFAQALIPAALPLAVIGGAVNLYLGANKDRAARADMAKKRMAEAEDVYRFVVGVARNNLPLMEQQLHQCSDEYNRQQVQEREEIARSRGFDFSEPAYSIFMERLDRYIENLSAAAEDCREENQPPLEQYE